MKAIPNDEFQMPKRFSRRQRRKAWRNYWSSQIEDGFAWAQWGRDPKNNEWMSEEFEQLVKINPRQSRRALMKFFCSYLAGDDSKEHCGLKLRDLSRILHRNSRMVLRRAA